MRYELTDDEWAAIKPMLPNKPRGVPRVNDRRVLWVLRSGAPWRDLPSGARTLVRLPCFFTRSPCAFPGYGGDFEAGDGDAYPEGAHDGTAVALCQSAVNGVP